MAKNMDNFKDRFKTALVDSGMTQQELSNKTKIPKSSISQYLSGYTEPKNDRIYKISKVLNVSEAWLLGFDVERNPSSEPTNTIKSACIAVPILGTICAGDGIYCEQNYEGSFFIDKSVKADLCIKIKGSSMINKGIKNGDYAFIRKVYDYKNGKVYACLLKDENEAVLEIVNRSGDTLILSPANSDFEPIIKDIKDVIIIGECVGVYHNM